MRLEIHIFRAIDGRMSNLHEFKIKRKRMKGWWDRDWEALKGKG